MAVSGTPLVESSTFTANVYPPLANSTVQSNDVAVGEQALANRTKYLNEDTTGGVPSRVAKAGDTMTGALVLGAGATVSSGQTLALNGATVSGSFTVSGVPTLTGRRVIPRARVAVSDASQTLDVTQGDRFVLTVNPAAPRTMTLKNTSPAVPANGECMVFLWTPGSAAVGGGTQYTFEREDSTVVATFVGSAVLDTGAVWAEFEYSGGVWRLGLSSGTLHDGTDYYGMVAGAGA